MKKTRRFSPFKLPAPLTQASSSPVMHKPTAPASTLRKLPFCFWSLPSFIICSSQCKAGKSKECFWSFSYGHVYPKPCCEPVKMKEPTTCRTHHTISPSVNKEGSRNLSYLRLDFSSETQRVIHHHVQHHPPSPTPAGSPAHKLMHHTLGWWQCHTAETGAWSRLCF